jgi:hypothetical protein
VAWEPEILLKDLSSGYTLTWRVKRMVSALTFGFTKLVKVCYTLSADHTSDFRLPLIPFYRAIIDPSSEGKRGAKHRVYIELGSGQGMD